MSDVTRILSQLQAGKSGSAEELLPVVYEELRRLSAQKLARERPGHTLEATALVHEAYLRLVDDARSQQWENRGHFFAAAAEAMRRILVESARRKACARRADEALADEARPANGVDLTASIDDHDLLDLDDALGQLASADPVAAELVKLRYFAGLTMEEAAETLEMSTRNAYYTWAYARSWLRCALDGGD